MSSVPLNPTSLGPAKQPDIAYHPDEAKYRAREARRLAEDPSLLKVALPEGFPTQVEGPIVWKGSDWTSEGQWVYRLSSEELAEIQAGLDHFKSKSLRLSTLFQR